jgi:hypothetical protein
MDGPSLMLETTKIGMFKFYTVDSNIFMGIVSLIFAIDEYKLLNNKIQSISDKKYILKLMSTTSVALTFLTVFLYLGRIADGGIYVLLLNSNLFVHLIILVLSIITFIFFERTKNIKIKKVIYSMFPTLIYAIGYLINILSHVENGKVLPKYDWYYFVQRGLQNALWLFPSMIFASYVIGLILYVFNNFELKKRKEDII